MRCLSAARQICWPSSGCPERLNVHQKQRNNRIPYHRTCAATSDREKESTSASQSQGKDLEESQETSTSGNTSSIEEIRNLANARRQTSREDNMGLIEGILDETRRIFWPSPVQALKDTLVVVGIVAVSALVLFGLNTGLTEGSRLLYDNLGH